MNRINEFNLEPGTYRHYKGGIYVVETIATHAENDASKKMEPLPDPMVVYRDLAPVVRHVNGRPMIAHQVYMRKLSEFTASVSVGDSIVKRFTQI